MADINRTRAQVADILLNAESMCKRGGLPGQVLAKASEDDFDMKWVTPTCDTADAVTQGDTRPVTSAAVYAVIGDIESALASI